MTERHLAIRRQAIRRALGDLVEETRWKAGMAIFTPAAQEPVPVDVSIITGSRGQEGPIQVLIPNSR